MTRPGADGAARALRSILGEQARVFDELARIVAAQRQAVLGPDPDALEELGARGQTLATRHGLLERERARLEADGEIGPDEAVEAARQQAERSLARLLRETALLRGIVSRIGEVVPLRTAAVLSALGEVYLPSGQVRDDEGRRRRLDVGV